MSSRFEDFKKEQDTMEVLPSDPLYKRIFKTRQKYINEGLLAGSNRYKVVFKALSESFENVKKEMQLASKEKQHLIDELLEILKMYESGEKGAESEDIERFITLCEECMEILQTDIQLIETKEMLINPLDATYIDWRKAHDLIKKN